LGENGLINHKKLCNLCILLGAFVMENPSQATDQAGQAEKQRQQEQARRNILEQILTPEARERRIEE
jgi:hypothetical protein